MDLSYDLWKIRERRQRSSKVNVCTLVWRSGCCTSDSDSALFHALFSTPSFFVFIYYYCVCVVVAVLHDYTTIVYH